jgi:hypothetical protein
MKSITRLSLALMMFALFSISYLVTTVSADPRGNAGIQNKWGTPSQDAPQGNYNAPNARRGQMGGQTHQGAAGTRQGGQQHYNGNLSNTRGYQPQGSSNAPHRPDNTNDQGASGSSYRLNQPVNQGGVNGVLPGPR